MMLHVVVRSWLACCVLFRALRQHGDDFLVLDLGKFPVELGEPPRRIDPGVELNCHAELIIRLPQPSDLRQIKSRRLSMRAALRLPELRSIDRPDGGFGVRDFVHRRRMQSPYDQALDFTTHDAHRRFELVRGHPEGVVCDGDVALVRHHPDLRDAMHAIQCAAHAP